MLQIANLEVVYHSVLLVVKGVSLEVPERGVVALLGANGAGKTTTLRALTGMLDVQGGEVTKGTITYAGEDLLRLSPDRIIRSGIAQVMEGRRILADLTVEENLLAGGHTLGRGALAQSLHSAYQRFPILEARRRQAGGYLSGGEQQMLAIARALMARPRLLVLDEPSLGLAPKIVGQVADLIAELAAEGVAILLVEQNAALALSLADYGYVMESGKVVIDGTADELRGDRDIQEFYLGLGAGAAASYRDVKHYRRRKRWLS